jgi:hypothetical protein
LALLSLDVVPNDPGIDLRRNLCLCRHAEQRGKRNATPIVTNALRMRHPVIPYWRLPGIREVIGADGAG